MNKIIRILHLENDINDAELVREKLAQANINCSIDVIETEAEFLKLLNEKEYQLILGDYTLPTYDGILALEYASNNYPQIPFVLVSGSIEEDAGIESLLHGASDYVSKRKLSRLIPAIKRALSQAEEHKHRQIVEKALKKSQLSLALAQEVGNIGSWDYDIVNDHIAWSDQTYLQFGLKPGEIEPSADTFQKYIHPDDKEKISQAIEDAFNNNAIYSLDVKMIKNDGSEWIMHTQGNVIRDKNGKPIRFIGIQQDITERKNIEKALQQSEEKYKSLFEDNLAGVYKSTIDGRILECNNAFVKMFGYTNIDEVLSTHVDKFFISAKDRPAYISKLKQYKKLSNQEVHLRRKDGSNIWITENVVLIDNNIMIGTVIDITRTKHMTQELLEAKNSAEKADKLKSEFLAQMSHEIRTPINTILNSLAMIKTEISAPRSDDLEYFYNAVNRASFRLIRTIELILNMSELQLGTYIPNVEKINLELDIIKRLIHQFNPSAIQKGLKLTHSVESTIKSIRGDEYSILQVFTNLIDNAIKYTSKGKISLRLYESSSGNINIDVADTGIGIEAAYLPDLFEAFSQEQQGYTRSFEGNGLGMAIVKGYCELNNADISVKSQKDVGTIFTVSFPKESIAD